MTLSIPASLIDRARQAFAADLASPPPLSLRGANDVDGYRRATPFDPEIDEPTDDYFEGYAFWGLGYLDAASWRHYLPLAFAYASRHPDDPRMVVEALVRSLRPPDRYPPRLATLTVEQEAVVCALLERLATDPAWTHLCDEAQQALAEWWGPEPRSRPSADEIMALRTEPATYRVVGNDGYRLEVPDTLTGSGLRDIPEPSRRVETWGGAVCGDAYTVIAINTTPLEAPTPERAVADPRALFRAGVTERGADVAGAVRARRLDGFVDGESPAEPQAFTMVLASTRTRLVALSIRTWPRDDVAHAVERIVASFVLTNGG